MKKAQFLLVTVILVLVNCVVYLFVSNTISAQSILPALWPFAWVLGIAAIMGDLALFVAGVYARLQLNTANLIEPWLCNNLFVLAITSYGLYLVGVLPLLIAVLAVFVFLGVKALLLFGATALFDS